MDYEYIRNQLDIVPVNELIPQEEKIEKNLLRLKEAMLNIGQLVDPIIIDNKHKIVLDGNHRMKVLEMIKVPNAVCQVVDYSDENIKVGIWYPSDRRISKKLLENTGAELKKVEYGEGKEILDKGGAVFLLYTKDGCWLVNEGKYGVDELIEEQQEILEKSKNNFRYIPDYEAFKEVEHGNGVLVRRAYSKEEIVERALSGKPFPPKSNMHIIPNRIIRLNMRLGWLHQERKEIIDYLERLLKNRVYASNVRRYVEPVIVIY